MATPVTCDVCGKQFKMSDTLDTHKRCRKPNPLPEQQQGFEVALTNQLNGHAAHHNTIGAGIDFDEVHRSDLREYSSIKVAKKLLQAHNKAITAARSEAIASYKKANDLQEKVLEDEVRAAEVALLEQVLLDAKGNEAAGYKPSRGWFIGWAEAELKERSE